PRTPSPPARLAAMAIHGSSNPGGVSAMFRNDPIVRCLSIPNRQPRDAGPTNGRPVQIFEGEPIRYRGRVPGSTPALLPGLAIRLREPVSKVVTPRGGNPSLPAGSYNPGGTLIGGPYVALEPRRCQAKTRTGLDFSPSSPLRHARAMRGAHAPARRDELFTFLLTAACGQ